MNPDDECGGATPVEVRCYFVRKRNALAVRARFEPLYMDYYLHLAELRVSHTMEIDTMLKEAIAGFTLHLAGRPWQEQHAWTVNFQLPLANFFMTGDNNTACVAGRVFTENVKVGGQQLFYSQSHKLGGTVRQSTVDFTGGSMLRAVESFYERSEQRICRIFEAEPEDFVMVSAQPQCDTDWLEGLTAEKIRALDGDEELSLLETRSYRWECGCSLEKLYRAVLPHTGGGIRAFFKEDEALKADCPRCGRHYVIEREAMERWEAEGRAEH